MATSQVYNAECWGCSVSEVPEVLLTNWNVIHDEECNSRTWIPMPSNTIQYSAAIPKNFKLQSLSHSLQLSPKRCGSNNDSAAVLPFQYRIFERAPPWKGSSSLSSNRSFHLTASFQNWKISRIYKQKVPLGCWAIPSSILWFWNEILYPVIYIYIFMCEFFMGLQLLGPLRDPIYLASLIITRNALDTRIS